MGFKNRISDNPNRKRVHIESVQTDSGGNITSFVVTGIERLEGTVTEEGTKLEKSSFLRALLKVQEEGINPVDLVEIKGKSTLYESVAVEYSTTRTFTFDYLGPELEVTFVDNNYFRSTGTKVNDNQIKVVLEGQESLYSLRDYIRVQTEVRFRLKSTKEFVKTILIMIDITPFPHWPVD